MIIKKSKKTRFQAELERTVSRRIVFTILTGCLFFCIAFLGIYMLNQRLNQRKHLDSMEDIFRQVYESTEEFLQDGQMQKTFIGCAAGENGGREIMYRLNTYNVDAPVRMRLIICDAEGRIRFNTFNQEARSLYLKEFNQSVADNAIEQGTDVYATVYFSPDRESSYVMCRPLYEDGDYVGSVSAYLMQEDWADCFHKYQYDAILTDQRRDIIYCSNSDFLKARNINKYRPEQNPEYVWLGDSRYRADRRALSDKGVTLYSLMYAPRNSAYIAVGVATILVLGMIWTIIFFRMLQDMSEKTSQSVEQLMEELRFVRKKDANHVIDIHTGDEFEEIADQINRMMESIRELNERNLNLVQINSRMELENLQAQINPHFIYNTLDNIKYLIAQKPVLAAELIERFTHILRYSINNTKHSVSLREDMEYIQDYLVIQSTRFGDRFTYTVEIEEECLEDMVPKLLLQPLIENSIKYGFRKKTDIHVGIKGFHRDGCLCLAVSDDGPGVPANTLGTLLGILMSEDCGTGHNGLQNINRRVILEYGGTSGMTIESREGEGFLVNLKLWMGESYV